MDASVLIVGGSDFPRSLIDEIHSLATVEIAPNPREAIPLIQAQQPDVLLVLASQPGSLDLCHQIKSQNQLAWIYCIVIDDQPPLPPSEDAILLELMDPEVAALDEGADAYIRLYPLHPNAEGRSNQVFRQQKRLLLAQVRAGLRLVQNHRELMRANDILSAIALSDPLTELSNRRALEWELPRQIHNTRARGTAISLIMLDVDYFKTINDTHGHLVGDRALQLIAARLRHNLRFYDTPFRYGGEEFVIILSDTGAQEARAIAHRLCRLISEQPFTISESLDLSITISAGVATLTDDDDHRGISLLRQADQNLLKAKSQGRNRVVSSLDHDPTDEPSQNDT